MELEVKGNVIDIKSPIISISDTEHLISVLKSKSNEKSIVLNINSFSLPSSVIGELFRLNDNGVSIQINVKDATLYELLDELNLTKKFNIRKI